MRQYWYRHGPDLRLLVLCIAIVALSTAAQAQTISPQRQQELIHLLKQDCGSCHGMTLKGGLGPPLLPREMSARDVDALQRIIPDGVPDTPMPPWRGLLTEAEARWLAMLLQQGLPDD